MNDDAVADEEHAMMGREGRKMDRGRQRRHPGIRRRVMLYLAAFVAFVLALLWLFQIAGLNDFYRWDKTRQIRAASDAVAQNLDNEQLNALMDMLANRSDVCILLLDEGGHTIMSSEDIRDCLIHRMPSRSLAHWCQMAPEDGRVVTELFSMQREPGARFNPRNFRGRVPEVINSQHQSLLCARRVTLPGGGTGYLLLNTIITPLDSTVETLRMQLTIITLVVALGALLLAWLISRRVTRPIILTNAAARALSRGQYEAPSKDLGYREIAELNETLTQAAVELGRVEHLQHELIANVSHDLRTPLTMIGGYAEMMRDIPGEATAENLQVVIDETSRLNSLVSELLDFSKLQSGSVTLEMAPFDLTGAVEAIVQRVARMTEKDGFCLTFEPEERVMVLADEKRIGQVVYNLIGNALTYTGEDRQVAIRQETADGRVRLSVQDTGVGIAPEDVPLIWNRYYRARENHRRAVIGSGLGLSIVRSILEKHGAAYGVDSTPGEGSTFWFELPVHAVQDGDGEENNA